MGQGGGWWGPATGLSKLDAEVEPVSKPVDEWNDLPHPTPPSSIQLVIKYELDPPQDVGNICARRRAWIIWPGLQKSPHISSSAWISTNSPQMEARNPSGTAGALKF